MVSAPQDVIDTINNGEADDRPDREPLPGGDYLVMVVGVEEYPAKDENTFGGVNVKYEVVQPREYKGRWLWDRLSFSKKAAWKIRDFWDAAEFDYDSDFEEVVDDPDVTFILEVTLEKQKLGKNKGNLVNDVGAILQATAEALAMIDD